MHFYFTFVPFVCSFSLLVYSVVPQALSVSLSPSILSVLPAPLCCSSLSQLPFPVHIFRSPSLSPLEILRCNPRGFRETTRLLTETWTHVSETAVSHSRQLHRLSTFGRYGEGGTVGMGLKAVGPPTRLCVVHQQYRKTEVRFLVRPTSSRTALGTTQWVPGTYSPGQ
jgi:hypothetical protein